ncbi:MAG TPA: hypothetical protein VM901_03645 [Bdellovibrionota bacterium]|jgi:pimeloyl-ACP methyl ester carboxylesterase|nr:hypothetical protein [Bdellovibrionota bacterium]
MRQFKNLVLTLAVLGASHGYAGGKSPSGGVLIEAHELTEPGWAWYQDVINIAHNKEFSVRPPNMPKGTSIRAFQLIYKTKDLAGKTVKASGLVRLRSDLTGGTDEPIPMVSYQHSTRIKRSDGPSMNLLDPEAMGGLMHFASRGYLWAMPDLLGLGISHEPQSYLHARGQAIVCSDFLLAVAEWASARKIKLDRNIIVMGYSQGGHNTLALQKFLESPENRTGFSVRASFPMAGPYSVAGVGLKQALKSKSPSQLLFVALAFYGLSSDPKLKINLKDIISEKYESVLPKMLNGDIDFTAATKLLPRHAEQFFTPTFLANALMMQENHPMLQALVQQDVVDFEAKAPVYLIHALKDEVVLYENSTLAEEYLKRRGTQVKLITLDKDSEGKEYRHASAALAAFSEAWAEVEKLDHR